MEPMKILANGFAAATVSTNSCTASFSNCLLFHYLRRFDPRRVKTCGNLDISSSCSAMSPDA